MTAIPSQLHVDLASQHVRDRRHESPTIFESDVAVVRWLWIERDATSFDRFCPEYGRFA
jgi:hypothetical protein